MSIPTPQMSTLSGLDSPQIQPPHSMEVVTLEDVKSGKVNVQSLIDDVNQMKLRLNDIRSQMDSMLNKMASVDETINPQNFYNEIQTLVFGIKSSYDEFNSNHKRIDPLITQQLAEAKNLK